MRFFVSALLLLPLFGASVDEYYHKTFEYLRQSINSLDIFLSDDNRSVRQKFSIRTSIETITESRERTRFRFNFRANLSLPRTQKKLNLFLQEFRKSDSIDNETQNEIDRSIKERSFLLGLQYITKAHLSYRAGIRFHKISPDPFVSASWEDTLYFGKNWLYYGDRLAYYLDRHLDNRAFAIFQHKVDEHTLFSFENSYRYTDYLKEHQITNAIAWYRSLGKYEFISPRFEIYSLKEENGALHLDYYYAGITYESRFFRKWLFYRVEPAVVCRKTYHFKPGLRLMLRVGITFEQN